jgi:two-component system cell cycle response regulator
MRHLAYLLIGDPDPDSALSRSEALTEQGYRCIQASDAHTLLALANSRKPDVILLGSFAAPVDSTQIVSALKSADATQNIPIVLTDAALDGSSLEGFRDAGADDLLPPDDDLEELIARLPRLSRSSVMFSELQRRVKTAAEFGVDIDPRQFRRGYPEEPQVIAVAQNGNHLTELGQTLNESGLHCIPEVSPFRAADRLDEGRFDAAVIAIDEGDDLSRVQYLCAHIRNNPRLFNLPTLVLSNGRSNRVDMDLYRGGAAIVLPASAKPALLSTYIHMLVNRQRLRWTMRDPYKATLNQKTADKTGVAYSEAFWNAHLPRCVAAAQERGSNLALGYIDVPTLPRIREEFGEENAEILAHQLADWITGMTRIEDTVARVGPDAFAILLPETPEHEANRVVQRIIGILHSSEFHLGEEVMQVIHAWAEGGVAGLQEGDNAASLLARAKALAT